MIELPIPMIDLGKLGQYQGTIRRFSYADGVVVVKLQEAKLGKYTYTGELWITFYKDSTEYKTAFIDCGETKLKRATLEDYLASLPLTRTPYKKYFAEYSLMCKVADLNSDVIELRRHCLELQKKEAELASKQVELEELRNANTSS